MLCPPSTSCFAPRSATIPIFFRPANHLCCIQGLPYRTPIDICSGIITYCMMHPVPPFHVRMCMRDPACGASRAGPTLVGRERHGAWEMRRAGGVQTCPAAVRTACATHFRGRCHRCVYAPCEAAAPAGYLELWHGVSAPVSELRERTKGRLARRA